MSSEQIRIEEKNQKKKDWLHWGPYLSERQWATVREDYSEDGHPWEYFTHDMSRSRAYRWGEDGIAGISDRYCNICFGLAFWNGCDPILKERLFGLTNLEGNHGEDVKEHYFYLDNVPTHSYMKYLYKYPQGEYPYSQLVDKNKERGLDQLEYELQDTGILNYNRYFDIFIEYAKNSPEDILIKISIFNRHNTPADIHILPTLWLRNHWSFRDMSSKPNIKLNTKNNSKSIIISHPYVGNYNLYFDKADKLLFTENETNNHRLFNTPNDHPYKKDLFHSAVINQDFSLATDNTEGTKFSPYYKLRLQAEEKTEIRLRLTNVDLDNYLFDFDRIFDERVKESADFYKSLSPKTLPEDIFNIQKQAFSGLLWSKQYYNYDVEEWLYGDPKQPTPPVSRLKGRNSEWKTFRNHDILIMPDAWEYPWFAVWDCAFHSITLAHIDVELAKEQLLLFMNEWYMSPKGNFPAYEWSFDDSNPPVHPWAAWKIYSIEKKQKGKGDIKFLKRVFNKLALNFTWWVNKKDYTGKNVFEGGFLGLDNIGVFDRSHGVPEGAILEQVDGTAWMALYCLKMFQMSLEISLYDDSFEDMATKYFGHFVFIAEALNKLESENTGVWDEKDGFFYDKLIFPDNSSESIKVRSVAGLLAIIANVVIDKETLDKLPKFKRSLEWFKINRKDKLCYPIIHENDSSILLSLVPQDRLKRILSYLLDENEFLSPYGIRALSKFYQTPYSIDIKGKTYSINYEPAESVSGLFGGNSNWRGPIWFPVNYIIVSSLKEYSKFFGDNFEVEFPTGSGNVSTLKDIANDIRQRLIHIFEKDSNGNRAVNGLYKDLFLTDYYKDYIWFYEYFDGDSGRGVGASHQTGWTALVSNLILEE